ncbi:DNA-processing protein DprA [Gordonia aichiensis]
MTPYADTHHDDTLLRAWTYLSAVAEPPCPPIRRLIDEIGPVAAAEAIRTRRVPSGHDAVLSPTSARSQSYSPAEDLDRAAAVGARLITPDDAEWPAWSLLPLTRLQPQAHGDEPVALWVRGPARLDDVGAASIALVGSRAASSYGEHVTGRLSGELCGEGWAVVSGGAYGIDGAAHRAALASAGITVAVLACGIDRDYPAGHARLLSDVAVTGAVVSEYAPGTTAARHRFLTRNRLVAALSAATVVVEAGRRSGAANTAAWARMLDRPVGAVPGPVTSATSVGCHRLIADGLGTLVTDAASVITLAVPDGGGDPGRGRERPTDTLTDDEKRVHDAIPGQGSVTIAEISFAAGLDVSIVRAALAGLEIAGLIAGDGGGWRLSA